MRDIPQVVLFGSIYGDWRERVVIPVLEELNVSYFDPSKPDGWTPADGDLEAEVMARCETIVMVINRRLPSFTSLAETGWAALGAIQRGQHFILQVDQDYNLDLPDAIISTEEGARLANYMQHWVTSSRHLVMRHALEFQHELIHVVDSVDAVAETLRLIYENRQPPEMGEANVG